MYSSTHTSANVIICGRGPHTATPATAPSPSAAASATAWVRWMVVRTRMNQKPAHVTRPKKTLMASWPPTLPRPYMTTSVRYSWSVQACVGTVYV